MEVFVLLLHTFQLALNVSILLLHAHIMEMLDDLKFGDMSVQSMAI